MWKAAARFGCPVVQNNFELPGLRVMGSMDAVDPHGRVRFVNRMNAMLADWAAATPNFYLHDLCWLSALSLIHIFIQLARARHQARVRGVNAVHVRVDLAQVRVQRGRNGHGAGDVYKRQAFHHSR